jgi:putative tryptophan/tyrosine transport system substrate-binding protein
MKRRQFITLLGGVATWPLAARAQRPVMPVIGFLTSRAPLADTHLLEAFRGGLRDMGYVEGQNLTIEYRFAENHYERLPDLAADLVRRNVAAIFANGISVPPAMSATGAIPIVFTTGGDPVKLGFVTSLHSPGGNATGITTSNIANAVKRLDLLREMVPAASTFGFLQNPASPLTNLVDVQNAAAVTRKRLVVISVREDREFEPTFATLVQQDVGALLVGADPLFVGRRAQIVALAARYSIPAIYFGREFTEAGGLMSYAASLADAYRGAGAYIGRILKGTKPGDLPVTKSTKFELLINLKTAKALGLTVPPSLLAAADDVIE